MTNDEMERAMDFILKSQARAEARIGQAEERQARTDEQLRQLTVKVDALTVKVDALAVTVDAVAELQRNLVQVFTQNLEEQGRTTASLREADKSLLSAQQAFLASQQTLRASQESLQASQDSQARINETLSAAIAELAAKQGQTEVALAQLTVKVVALVSFVEEGRGGGG